MTSEFVAHEPCPNCGSKDNLARYADGHGYCFGCEYYEESTEERRVDNTSVKSSVFVKGEVVPLNKRNIYTETCNKFDYKKGTYNNKKVQIANYYKNNVVVGQKLRFANKDFVWIGDTDCGLYGEWLWRDGGKKIVVVEGEIDCLSYYQVSKYPVVSVRTGAAGAKKDIQKSLEFLEKFDEVVFMFDSDEVGIKAMHSCAPLLTPGKAKISILPLKDANEMLKANRTKELLDCMWSAKTYRPDGIVAGADLWDLVNEEDDTESVPYPFHGLNKKIHGIRRGELITITAGSGTGKSAFVREIGFDLVRQGLNVGFLMLEETVKRTALGLMSIHLNKPLHLLNIKDIEPDEFKQSFTNSVGSGNVFLYDHFGSTSTENLLTRIRYMAKGLNCQYIILDHLSIVVSGIADGDERRLIDNTMTALRSLVQETNICLFVVSHLRRPSGDEGHEDGREVSLSQLRGSHSIVQLSDGIISLIRNQLDDSNSNKTKVKVLKNRFSGETGSCSTLTYQPESGRLLELTKEFDNEDY